MAAENVFKTLNKTLKASFQALPSVLKQSLNNLQFTSFKTSSFQKDLKNVKAVIIGCGAVGSRLAQTLASLGVEHFLLLDFDLLELENLKTGLFSKDFLGFEKTFVLQQLLSNYNAKLEVLNMLLNYDNHKQFLKALNNSARQGFKLWLFDCVDNVQTKLLVNNLALKHGFNLVHGAANNAVAQAMIITRNACLSCVYEKYLQVQSQTQGLQGFNAKLNAKKGAKLSVKKQLKALQQRLTNAWVSRTRANALTASITASLQSMLFLHALKSGLQPFMKQDLEQTNEQNILGKLFRFNVETLRFETLSFNDCDCKNVSLKPGTFLINICKARSGLKLLTRKPVTINIEQLQKYFKVLEKTSYIAVLDVNGVEVIVFKHGELLFKHFYDIEFATIVAEAILQVAAES
ncbi:ThiF family adenylyltransferase [Candidatus Woesearchaeota archaeon]|nr:ThiF family adenylyltransferase [Candidatus Woesearchaeota archaeon]